MAKRQKESTAEIEQSYKQDERDYTRSAVLQQVHNPETEQQELDLDSLTRVLHLPVPKLGCFETFGLLL